VTHYTDTVTYIRNNKNSDSFNAQVNIVLHAASHTIVLTGHTKQPRIMQH